MLIRNKFNHISLDILMGMYHINFIKINQLLDFYQLLPHTKLISATSKIPIEIELLASARYTSTIKMNYLFTEFGPSSKRRHTQFAEENIPNAEIRIYHDARQAEVLGLQNQNRMATFFSLTYHHNLTNIDARWQLNIFLHKWLQYCIGHKYTQC